MVGGQLLISGTAANDHIFIGLTSDDMVRVRIDNRLFGDLNRPASYVIEDLGAANLLTLGAGISLANVAVASSASDPDSAGTLLLSASANDRDLALLQWLAAWNESASDDDQIGLKQRRSSNGRNRIG
jgi:hypothetical protein